MSEVSKVSYTRNPSMLRYRNKHFPKFARMHTETYLWSTGTAKAIKAQQRIAWLNCVYHTQPADRSMLPFIGECLRVGEERLVHRLVENINAAAERYPEFAPWKSRGTCQSTSNR